MPDILEASGASSADWVEEKGKRRGTANQVVGGGGSSVRIDPRTGIVSPQAVVRDSARERGELPMVAPRRALTEQFGRR